jgi:hypothetical protein
LEKSKSLALIQNPSPEARGGVSFSLEKAVQPRKGAENEESMHGQVQLPRRCFEASERLDLGLGAGGDLLEFVGLFRLQLLELLQGGLLFGLRIVSLGREEILLGLLDAGLRFLGGARELTEGGLAEQAGALVQ